VLEFAGLPLARAPPGRPIGNGRTLYKWVDDQGVTHYGDHIPPEYASQEQHIINSQGVRSTASMRRKRRSSWPPRSKKDSMRNSASRDRNLLSTYASVQEIERLRDQR
jgi:hypothetical protein